MYLLTIALYQGVGVTAGGRLAPPHRHGCCCRPQAPLGTTTGASTGVACASTGVAASAENRSRLAGGQAARFSLVGFLQAETRQLQPAGQGSQGGLSLAL